MGSLSLLDLSGAMLGVTASNVNKRFTATYGCKKSGISLGCRNRNFFCLVSEDECNSVSYSSIMTSIDAQAQVSAYASATSHKSSILEEVESHLDETFTYVFKKESAVTVTVSLKDADFTDNHYEVLLTAPIGGLTLHWAVNNWSLPNSSWWPKGSNQVTDKALETPFVLSMSGSWQITIKIPEREVPRCLVFVLRDKDGLWYNNNGCFKIPLKPFEMHDLVEQVVVPETSFENWSLFNRFILASELLDAAEEIGATGMAFMFTWLRFSAIKQLAWYRKCNYQSKDIGYVQERLASLIADKTIHGKDSSIRQFARMIMATLPRGGGDAEQIRMGILNIMRDNGIREGHRPGIEDHFLEQWHQKLHTNTSPEDIHICEAYLHFLHTNSMDNFYRTLWENGHITREWLEKIDHPITAHPVHLPQLIPAFKHFLWILKTVHSGADLDVMVEMSKGYLSDELKGMLYNILENRDAWWVPGRIVECRKRLKNVWKGDWVRRDVLFLDIALDNYFGICIGRIDKLSLQGDDLSELVSLVLENSCIATENEELDMCLAYWNKVKAETRWTRDWSILALAATDRISLALEGHMDNIYKLVQPHAEALGTACQINAAYISNFGEEVVRGQVLFNLSSLLQRLQVLLRGTAGISPWQIVSHRPSAAGNLLVIPSLSSTQGQRYASSQIILTKKVDGMEDIPSGVTAIICSSSVDMLSHCAIRARDSQVLLASCFDEDYLRSLEKNAGKNVVIVVDASGQVVLSESTENAESACTTADASQGFKPIIPTNIKRRQTDKLVLSEQEFESGKVGGKSLKLAMLRSKLDSSIELPPSIALPLGVFEQVMSDPINSSVNSPFSFLLERLKSASDSQRVPSELAKIRDLVGNQLSAPKALRRELSSMAESNGIIQKSAWNNEDSWAKTWQAIRQVWCSKWTDRAWLSRRTRGIPEEAVYMGCLLQKVIPADYAFVIHTVHPILKDPAIMFCEIVAGLGEVLVGNYKGSAFSFSIPKDNSAGETVTSLPSKSVRVCIGSEESVIARSDSNGEDLQGFAGAGLYDSVIVHHPLHIMLDYSKERLIWDSTFRSGLVQVMRRVGMQIESAFGGEAQDIEGVISNGKVAIVQSRPQGLI